MKKLLSSLSQNIKSLLKKTPQRKYLVIIGILVIALFALAYSYQEVKLFNGFLVEKLNEKLGPHLGYNPKSHNNPCFNIPSGSVRPVFLNLEDEIKATDLVWREDYKKLPVSAKKLIRKEVPPGIEDYEINVAFFDLNNDGVDEVFVNNRSMGSSGGQGFLILENQKGKWKEIALFTGSFIMINRWAPKGYEGYTVIIYWFRGGGADTDQVVLAYKNHEYKRFSVTPVPLNVLYSNDFQKMILDLNWMCWDYWN
ncbi:hypothetical protein [Candidatus Methylopumilus planktonicus]|uniref:hypothetical protein n=1 Tax=Candidatus Methylopumilus planktonicus TaxID=1581557 RepID=UPI00111E535C|nr:hypothetical protein [Candidatus Methylopumilus planktonicus]QDD11007.1 hypothetical protein FIT64_04040 [Candidatus Methylopumilus planktonicus]QDD23477.1 hypothetical protein FIT63_04040 [Candidatus Methylopumilus planktonicus]